MVKMIGDKKMVQEVDPTIKKQFIRAGWVELVEAPQKFKEPEIQEPIQTEQPITEQPVKHKGGRGHKKTI